MNLNKIQRNVGVGLPFTLDHGDGPLLTIVGDDSIEQHSYQSINSERTTVTVEKTKRCQLPLLERERAEKEDLSAYRQISSHPLRFL